MQNNSTALQTAVSELTLKLNYQLLQRFFLKQKTRNVIKVGQVYLLGQ